MLQGKQLKCMFISETPGNRLYFHRVTMQACMQFIIMQSRMGAHSRLTTVFRVILRFETVLPVLSQNQGDSWNSGSLEDKSGL